MKKFKAYLAIVDPKTDEITSKRSVGKFDSQEQASTAAWAERQPGETVLINVPGELSDYEEEEGDTIHEITKREQGLDETNR